MSYQPPSKIYTMREIGLEGQGISPNAVTAPFQLFTEEAIKQMRAEIFSQDVMDNCQYMSAFVKSTIRGMGSARAPFTCDAWNSPEVLAKVSEVAGIELTPAMDYEIAAINISVNDQTVPIFNAPKPDEDNLPAFAWHRDSYPFVCVTMLSDCVGMTGGETALKTASGEIMKVRGPAMGTAVVMQGRYIEHQALKAYGGRERISMVTSFRAKSPLVRDESVLTGVRPISNLSELYTQYTKYRLEVLEEKIRDRLKKEQYREFAKRDFDLVGVRTFLTEQKDFLDSMLEELIE
ncbi:unnamed protein product [Penicillium salamii]|nr:unnamed protein product [Penicillium salamii]CAG8067413.1 unnamed protein product [Penicillium salamii]